MRDMAITHTHANIKVQGHSVQSDNGLSCRQTDGRTETIAYTCRANAVGNYTNSDISCVPTPLTTARP